MTSRVALAAIAIAATLAGASAQVIQFEQNGLKYQTLTHAGVTVMFAHLPQHVKEFAIIQVTITNGSKGPYMIRPEDFIFERADHVEVRASTARYVIDLLRDKASGNDVVKLITTYEASLYGMSRIQSTNGYEQRRQAALA